jgi:hypothetical protein
LQWLDSGLEPFLIRDMDKTDASGSKGPSRRLFLSASAVAAATVPLVSQATAASAASNGTSSVPHNRAPDHISKDNVQFGLRAVDQNGNRSPVAFPLTVA